MLEYLDASRLKSKNKISFRTNLEKKLNFRPKLSNYRSIGTVLDGMNFISFHFLSFGKQIFRKKEQEWTRDSGNQFFYFFLFFIFVLCVVHSVCVFFFRFWILFRKWKQYKTKNDIIPFTDLRLIVGLISSAMNPRKWIYQDYRSHRLLNKS